MTIKREGQENCNVNMASLFHGFLMEKIDPEYAGYLHQNSLKPYSQFLTGRGDEWQWRINTLTDDAFSMIALPLMDENVREIKLSGKNIAFKITEKLTGENIGYERLTRRIYLESETKKTTKVKFLTPCSFKSGGSYVIFPDVRLIFQSLVNKFDMFSDSISVKDERAVQDLCEHTKIVGYKLRSTVFHVEGIKIPAFCGEITIKIYGPETLANLAGLLLKYACWSGIGIKTSLGMGAVDIE